MKRFLCGSLTALVMALPLYAQNPSGMNTTNSSMNSPAVESTDMNMNKTKDVTPTADEIEKQEESPAIRTQTKEIEMQQDSKPLSTSSDSSTVPTNDVQP